ncbi:MAG: rod shape-determining protein MreC [Candidatus Andersenbacteria bacterium]|nr:rod shape-determining protein MreC [Candidatus Andersenbacteria bacterium]
MRMARLATIGVLAALLGGLLVLQVPLLHGVRGWAWMVWEGSLGTIFNIGPLTIPNNVAEQLATLQAENIRLRWELGDYHRVREQLGTKVWADFSAIPAHVLAQSLDAFHARVVINRGARDGVPLGAPAVIHGSALVGFVTELHEFTAVLQLIFHPATSIPAEVVTETGSSRGLLQGKAFTSLQLSNVPGDSPLAQDQEVVTVDQQSAVPGGLLIGKIASVTNEPHEPWQQARVEAHFDPDALYAVAVLVPSGNVQTAR